MTVANFSRLPVYTNVPNVSVWQHVYMYNYGLQNWLHGLKNYIVWRIEMLKVLGIRNLLVDSQNRDSFGQLLILNITLYPKRRSRWKQGAVILNSCIQLYVSWTTPWRSYLRFLFCHSHPDEFLTHKQDDGQVVSVTKLERLVKLPCFSAKY